MSMDYIRRTYGVPAKRGARVKFSGIHAVIVGAKGHYLRIRIEGQGHVMSCHPTWRIEYLDAKEAKDGAR